MFYASEEFNPSFQVKGSRTPIKPTQIHLLRKGDHVGWHRPIGLIWHHAIVCDTDYKSNSIEVIHFARVKRTVRAKITKEWLNINQQKSDFFRFDYSEDINKMNPPDIVLKRAIARVGETGYNLFTNNCEHFATYCKTGIKDSAQIHWAMGKVKEGVQACILGIPVTETVNCVYDIKQMNRNRKARKITDKDFNKCTTQRVSGGVLGGGTTFAGMLAGGAIGSATLPVAGTVVGALVGGVVGSAVGKPAGTIFGHQLGRKLFR